MQPSTHPHRSAAWWAFKEARARAMDISALEFSRADCNEAAHCAASMGDADGESYYRDEASVYARELAKRADRALRTGDLA